MGMAQSTRSKTKAKEAVVIPTNPKSVTDFGYLWKKDEDSEDHEYLIRLRTPENGKFEFKGQKHYEALAKVVATDVARIVEETFGLERVMLPLEEDLDDSKFRYPILHSKDLFTNPRMVVFVLGAGAVSLAQWSRKLCINNSLAEGTVMLYIHEAMNVRGCSVLLTNPNVNSYMTPDNKPHAVPGAHDPSEHLYYLWKNFISKSKVEHVAIIAHSYGGVSTMDLLANEKVVPTFFPLLRVVGLTDSVHSQYTATHSMASTISKWLKRNAINYIRGSAQLGTDYGYGGSTLRQAAGTPDHDATSYNCRNLLWKFVDERMPLQGSGTNGSDNGEILAVPSSSNELPKKSKRSSKQKNAREESSKEYEPSANRTATENRKKSKKTKLTAIVNEEAEQEAGGDATDGEPPKKKRKSSESTTEEYETSHSAAEEKATATEMDSSPNSTKV